MNHPCRNQLCCFFVAASVIALGWLLSSACLAQETNPVQIEQLLNKSAKIDFRNITLEDAFDRLSQSIGVKISLDTSSMAQLPFGSLTQLSAVQLQGMSWRDALKELLKPLALTFQTGSDRIFILGTEELLRQPQKLNLVELDALVRLQNSNLSEREENLIKQIREVTRSNFALIEFGKPREKTDEGCSEDSLSKIPQPAHHVLNLYCKQLGDKKNVPDATWYLRAELEQGRANNIEIIIAPAKRLIDMKLDRQITIQFKQQPVQTILQDLARQAVLNISFEPGCIATLDENTRDKCTLIMRDGSIKNALEVLSGTTGLAYQADQNGLYILAGDLLRQTAASQSTVGTVTYSNPLICTITAKLPGTDIETMVLIRQDDLTEYGLLDKYQQLHRDSIDDFMRYLKAYQPPTVSPGN
ncbi:MAG: hypothetical protein JXD22_07885 [Sedimentisphaerales bacterium]|nr:hypothetical protein [Sedimentisphaerales bacterium]